MGKLVVNWRITKVAPENIHGQCNICFETHGSRWRWYHKVHVWYLFFSCVKPLFSFISLTYSTDCGQLLHSSKRLSVQGPLGAHKGTSSWHQTNHRCISRLLDWRTVIKPSQMECCLLLYVKSNALKTQCPDYDIDNKETICFMFLV